MVPNRELGHEPETVISASVKVEGDFSSAGNVLIEGIVEGSLRTERDLRVGEKARIAADVSASNAVVAGEVRGNIACTERLELEPTAKIYGDVRTKILIVNSGASVNGRISMGAEAEERAAKSSKTESKPAKAVEKEKVPAEEKTMNPFYTA